MQSGSPNFHKASENPKADISQKDSTARPLRVLPTRSKHEPHHSQLRYIGTCQDNNLTCRKKELSRHTIRLLSSRSLSLSPMLPIPSISSKNCSKRPHDRAASGRRLTHPATTLPNRVLGRPLFASCCCCSPASNKAPPVPSSTVGAMPPEGGVALGVPPPVAAGTVADWSGSGRVLRSCTEDEGSS